MCVVEQHWASVCFCRCEKERERCANHRVLPLLPRLSHCVRQRLLWASCFCWKKKLACQGWTAWTPVAAALREREMWFELQCCCFYTFPSFGWNQNRFATAFSGLLSITLNPVYRKSLIWWYFYFTSCMVVFNWQPPFIWAAIELCNLVCIVVTLLHAHEHSYIEKSLPRALCEDRCRSFFLVFIWPHGSRESTWPDGSCFVAL